MGLTPQRQKHLSSTKFRIWVSYPKKKFSKLFVCDPNQSNKKWWKLFFLWHQIESTDCPSERDTYSLPEAEHSIKTMNGIKPKVLHDFIAIRNKFPCTGQVLDKLRLFVSSFVFFCHLNWKTRNIVIVTLLFMPLKTVFMLRPNSLNDLKAKIRKLMHAK